MTFWELVKNKIFYWQMFTLSKGKQILADGRTRRRPMLMPTGVVYTRRLCVPAHLDFYKVDGPGDTWTAHLAGTTLTIRMLKKVEDSPEPVMVKFFCPKCGKEMWKLVDWDDARQYSQELLRVVLVCSDCLLEEMRADRDEGIR